MGKAEVSQRPQINNKVLTQLRFAGQQSKMNELTCNNNKTVSLSITEMKQPCFELCGGESENEMAIWISIAVNNACF